MEKTPFLVLAVCLSALTAGAGESTTNTVANLGTVSVTARPITQEESISAASTTRSSSTRDSRCRSSRSVRSKASSTSRSKTS